MWNLLHALVEPVQSIQANLALFQMRTPTTAWDMILGGTLATKIVLLVLLSFSLLSWWLIFDYWGGCRKMVIRVCYHC